MCPPEPSPPCRLCSAPCWEVQAGAVALSWPRWLSPWGPSAEKGKGWVGGAGTPRAGRGRWGGAGSLLTPSDVLMGESLKRTLRHSSGHTARSSSGRICSSCCPLSTPRHLTVLRAQPGGGQQGSAPSQHRAAGLRGLSGGTHIREKPLSCSQAVTSAGGESGSRLGGLSWSGGQRQGTGGWPPATPSWCWGGWGGQGGCLPGRGSASPRGPAPAPGAPGRCRGRSLSVPCCPAPATTSAAGPAPGDSGDSAGLGGGRRTLGRQGGGSPLPAPQGGTPRLLPAGRLPS